MTDRLEKLESELKRLRPSSLPMELTSRIADEINRPIPRTWSDRLLILAMSSGAVAACLIAAIVFVESVPLPQAPSMIADLPASPAPRAGETMMAFAQADTGWWKRAELNRYTEHP